MSFDPTKPVQTRDGRKARIICTDRNDTYSIVALVYEDDINQEETSLHLADGRVSLAYKHNDDLVNVPVKHTGWMNIYPTNEYFDAANFVMPNSGIYKTRDEADLRNGHPDRIACIQIEFTEGEGL